MAGIEASNHVARVLSAASQMANAEPESRIALSWRRCLIDHKLDPAQQRPPQTFTESEIKRFFEPVEGLVQVAIPELEDLARVLRDSGYCVNFADTNGTMLVSRLPGGDYERVFRERDIYTGSNFSEVLRRNERGRYRARRAEANLGASRRALPRTVQHLHVWRSPAV